MYALIFHMPVHGLDNKYSSLANSIATQTDTNTRLHGYCIFIHVV